MLFTVSTKASSICGPLTSGRQNHYCFWAIGQNTQINLVACKKMSSCDVRPECIKMQFEFDFLL